MVCWSVVWVNPKELESRLTITIVCLLSLIAYNFVIDKDLPKLEYLTILDWIILISYVYATIPNFLSIFSFAYLKKKNKTSQKIELISKKYGALSYIIIIFLIVFASANLNPEFTSSQLLGCPMEINNFKKICVFILILNFILFDFAFANES